MIDPQRQGAQRARDTFGPLIAFIDPSRIGRRDVDRILFSSVASGCCVAER